MLNKQRNLNGVVWLIGHDFGDLAGSQLTFQWPLNGLPASDDVARDAGSKGQTPDTSAPRDLATAHVHSCALKA